MKKILLATTAVALSAGVAFAEGNVTVSGNARMGLQYNSAPAGGAAKTTFEKRMTVNIDASVESTSGITFGARVRLRSEENIATIATGARVYMKTGGLELAMGNINGAIESMPGLYDPSVGLTGLGWGGLVTNTADKGAFNWDAFSSTGNGAEGIEVTYSAGAFAGHLSYSDNTAGGVSSNALTDPDADGVFEERLALHLAYTMNDWTFALGMQDSSQNSEDKVALTIAGKIGDYGVGIAYADNDGVGKVAINGSATFGATTVTAYIADDSSVLATDLNYGLGVSYDLGGASVVGGIAQTAVGDKRADLGVSFSF